MEVSKYIKSPSPEITNDTSRDNIKSKNSPQESVRSRDEVPDHILADENCDLPEDLNHEVHNSEQLDAVDQKSYRKLLYTTLCRFVYPSIILNHLDIVSLTMVFRSWAMMWSVTILCICDATILFMGPSSFLAAFAAGIEIHGDLSVSAAFVTGLADICSVMFACLISVVTLAINWRIRGYPTEPELINDLMISGLCHNKPPTFEACIVPVMNDGTFLNIKTTVVTVFGMLFSFTILGYFQSVSKYGKLAWLLSSLYTIIVFSFNNVMPVWRPWHFARNVIVPVGMALAARFVVATVIFPVSSNYKFVNNLAIACMKLADVGDKIQDLSNKAQPSDTDFLTKFQFIQADTLAVFSSHVVNELDLELISNFEVWFTRFEKPALSELRARIRLALCSLTCYNFFYETMNNRYWDVARGAEPIIRRYKFHYDDAYQSNSNSSITQRWLGKAWKHAGDYEELMKKKFYKRRGVEQLNHLRCLTPANVNEKYEEVIRDYQPLALLSNELIRSVGKWLSRAASIFHRDKTSYDDRLEELKQQYICTSQCINELQKIPVPVDRAQLLQRYVTINYAKKVAKLAKWCIYFHHENSQIRLVWPHKSKGIYSDTKAEDLLDEDDFAYDGYHDNLGVALERTTTNFKPPLSIVQARNPDATPPRHIRHIFGMGVESVIGFFANRNFLFSLRRAIITTATLTTYFCKSTVHQSIEYWYLWVAVLTTYTMGRQAIDGVYGFFAKIVYTFFGCLVGMVAWYISAYHGNGNPYGYGVVTAFVWLYISFQRQFNNHFVPATSIVFSCTVTLVLGNSWNSGHYTVDGVELGHGFHVAWIRFVTVVIGLAIALLGTVFPQVYTAKQAVRQIIGTSLEHIGDLQSNIANFGVLRVRCPETRIIADKDTVTKEARAIITKLHSAEMLRKRLIYEPPLCGVYPTHRYKLLISYVHKMTLLYSLVYSFLDDIDDTSKIPLVLKKMGWTDPHLSSGTFSTLYMCCRALYDAKPLPSVTSGSLYEQYLFDILPNSGQIIHGYDSPQSEDPLISTAVSFSCQILRILDSIIMLVKDLVGEIYHVNMDLYDLEQNALP